MRVNEFLFWKYFIPNWHCAVCKANLRLAFKNKEILQWDNLGTLTFNDEERHPGGWVYDYM